MYGRGTIGHLQARLIGAEWPRPQLHCTKTDSMPKLSTDRLRHFDSHDMAAPSILCNPREKTVAL
jgi:hypothetical protein